MENSGPHDGGLGCDHGNAGACMEPIYSLLNPPQNTEDWNSLLRGSPRSAVTNRQYPQVRAKAAGWSHHDHCLLSSFDLLKNTWTLDEKKDFVK